MTGLYLNPKSRINRKTWRLGIVGLFIIALIVQTALGALATAMKLAGTTFGLGLFSLAILVAPCYALTVKRLNDRGRRFSGRSTGRR